MSASTSTNSKQDSTEELKTIFDPATCVRKGLCPVTQIRKQGEDPFESHSLYFEQHGNGPEKIVFIMGLNATSFAWAPQVEYFARLPEYSILVFDNRGVGNSGVPKGPYTTSGMAEDVVVLLEYIGWKENRSLHVVGISLGGMIAQELATRIPQRIVSLTLAVTTPGGWWWSNLPTWKGLSGLIRSMFTKDLDLRLPIILEMGYPVPWLDSKATDDPQGRTNREVQIEIYKSRIQMTRPPVFAGSMSQMGAAMSHYVSPERLRKISSSIPKVLIVMGDEDHMVDVRNSFYMKEKMPEAVLVQLEATGHAIHVQQAQKLNELLHKVFQEGREAV